MSRSGKSHFLDLLSLFGAIYSELSHEKSASFTQGDITISHVENSSSLPNKTSSFSVSIPTNYEIIHHLIPPNLFPSASSPPTSPDHPRSPLTKELHLWLPFFHLLPFLVPIHMNI
jgi:hypothetical protein